MLATRDFWVWALMAAACVDCGGKSSGAERLSPDESCACPSYAPPPGSECECPGLDCTFPRSFCWHGAATCTAAGEWEWTNPQNAECPAEPPGLVGLCTGEGGCQYEVDVGCGPQLLDLTCTCVDATWYLTGDSPPLCDCTAIETSDLCDRYRSDCKWSEELRRCEMLN